MFQEGAFQSCKILHNIKNLYSRMMKVIFLLHNNNIVTKRILYCLQL